jgi:hypothetical protein
VVDIDFRDPTGLAGQEYELARSRTLMCWENVNTINVAYTSLPTHRQEEGQAVPNGPLDMVASAAQGRALPPPLEPVEGDVSRRMYNRELSRL